MQNIAHDEVLFCWWAMIFSKDCAS